MQPELMIYNTLSRRKEPFRAIVPGKVNMFACGPTVQSLIHVGNARTYTFYDVVARYFSHLGYEVNFVMNITDIDEKITSAAKEENADPLRFAEKYTKAFLEDINSLKIFTVTKYERVSQYIQETIRQVSSLLQKGNAYVADGTVYFDTSTFPDYGKLSHQSRNQLTLRPLELSPKKKNLLDFALWRPVVLLDGRWDSPWGRGSPGWHIQDTAVTMTNFGPQYDVHGGAYELIYPHHEAEIAQAESLTGLKPFVHYWIHTGLVNVRGGKMSKSAGNVYTVRDLLAEFGVDPLRFYILSHNYKDDMEFDEKRMRKASENYSSMRDKAVALEGKRSARARRRDPGKVLAPFYQALNDDFDTPVAAAFVKKMIEAGVSEKDPSQVELYCEALKVTSNILGVDFLGKYK